MSARRLLAFGLLMAICLPPLYAQEQERRQEEAEDYYRKWLEEDVVYIITEEERQVFESLATLEEKDQFIEQFWRSRDPNPQTAENEFKSEHYRRISYVNERYFSGEPGWKTDRGMIYIKFGEPDSVERQPFGGPYRRPNSEGGGETTTLPWERWWYRHIPGIGEDVEIEFVDKGFSNDYRIALNPNEKDAFLYVAGHGNTQEEFDGNWTRFDRISAPLGLVDRDSPFVHSNDLPFRRLRRFAQLTKAPEIENPRLREIVDSAVHYEELPFSFRSHWLRAGDQALVPLTVSVDHKDLRFGADGQGEEARLNIFGRVKSLQGRIVSIFEDSVEQSRSDTQGLAPGRSLYQKLLVLEPGRYRLDLVVEDAYGGGVGTLQTGLIIPRLAEDKLAASPVILVDRVEPIAQDFDPSQPPEMFVLGTLKVLPHLGDVVAEKRHLMFYFQLYNAGIDGSTRLPSLDLSYQLVDEEGSVVAEKSDEGADRASYISGQRIAFLEYLDLRKAASPSLQLKIEVTDKVTGQSLIISEPVRIQRAPQADPSRP
ncbi:MAG TPA: GWxTD domain-containing protein [Acidobacteriota bacterium]|nr:GWxTD domain-containing protein [Acidobacteriota bacterium]